MTSKTLAELLLDLGVAQSHSRPSISDDNPYSEAQFKTMKYGPSYPERFANLEAARAWVRWFVDWYNQEHKHSGIALLSPDIVHSGQAPAVIAARQATLDVAYERHPERFAHGRPQAPQLASEVGINLPRTLMTVPTAVTAEALPMDAAGSRVPASQRPLDPAASIGQDVSEVPALGLNHAPHFA